MQIQFDEPNVVQRFGHQLASTATVAWFLSRTARHVDRVVVRLSGGRTTLTSMVTGLPVIFLTTTGAKSGAPRTAPLIAGVDGAKLVLFATNFGGAKNPNWYYNLRAHPEVTVSYRGASQLYLARLADEAERTQYWPMADAMYAAMLPTGSGQIIVTFLSSC